MNVFDTEQDLRTAILTCKQNQKRVAFVPTMGNLHEGHIHLVAKAKSLADVVVVSIFVNPLQFNNAQDLATYPRTLDEDKHKLEQVGADVLFLPNPDMLYPDGLDQITKIEVPGLSERLEGEHRPGHFTGVTTVVAKLFNLVQPDVAVFGKKDYQQWQLIQKMVADLNMPITIVGEDTQRESTGLARSSRNNLLSDESRAKSAALYECLQTCALKLKEGQDAYAVEDLGIEFLTSRGFTVDYVKVCNQVDLYPAKEGDNHLVILIAASIDNVRLIDNLEVQR